MPTPSDFLQYTQWAGYATLALALLTGLAFLLKWGLRFRMVGATGFMIVLTAGLFALGIVPFTRTVVPGAIRFSTVFDSGSTQAVITVPPTITESELTATLQQAASDLFSMGRLGRANDKLTIRARTVIHPEPDVSQPLYLGEVQRSLLVRDDSELAIKIYANDLAKLPKSPSPSTSENS